MHRVALNGHEYHHYFLFSALKHNKVDSGLNQLLIVVSGLEPSQAFQCCKAGAEAALAAAPPVKVPSVVELLPTTTLLLGLPRRLSLG